MLEKVGRTGRSEVRNKKLNGVGGGGDVVGSLKEGIPLFTHVTRRDSRFFFLRNQK